MFLRAAITTLLLASFATGQQSPLTFTGHYVLLKRTTSFPDGKLGPVQITLDFEQSATEIRITRTASHGEKELTLYRLDGSRTTSSGPTGLPVECTAQLKKQKLVAVCITTFRSTRGQLEKLEERRSYELLENGAKIKSKLSDTQAGSPGALAAALGTEYEELFQRQ